MVAKENKNVILQEDLDMKDMIMASAKLTDMEKLKQVFDIDKEKKIDTSEYFNK